MMTNIPVVSLGLIAVSRDCFPIALSEKRRAAIKAACEAKGLPVYEAKTTVENELDMLKAVAEVKECESFAGQSDKIRLTVALAECYN